MFDFQKAFEANQKLARDVSTQIASAAVEFSKVVVDANTKVANTLRDQITEVYSNVKPLAGFEAFAPKTAKKSTKADQE